MSSPTSTDAMEHASDAIEAAITPEMIAAGFSALTAPLREPWINAEFQDWIEATTRGQHEVNSAINLLLRKVYREMCLSSAHEKEREPPFQQYS